MKGQCPICQLDDTIIQHDGPRAITGFWCKRCGDFWIDAPFLPRVGIIMFNDQDKELLPYLSAYIRQSPKPPLLQMDNWRDLAKAHQSTSVPQKAIKLLGVLATRSKYPGQPVEIDTELDYPLIDASSRGEMDYFLTYLINSGYLERHGVLFIISVKGWEYIQPQGGGESGRCFIAMAFRDELTVIYDQGICLAVKECGFDPIRLDRQHHNEKICDKIIAEIRRAQFVIADFTFHRGGAYFEAGFALGLGRPVIWTCREDDLKNTHFDTRQYNHVVWSTSEDLKDKLTDRIRATIKGAKLS